MPENPRIKICADPERNTIMRSTHQPAQIDANAAVSAAVASTMRAIVQHTYGTADVLRLEQIAKPEIADDEVLVQVHAAGMDRGTWHFMTGRPYLMRVMGFGFRAPKNPAAGSTLPAPWWLSDPGSASSRWATRSTGSAVAPSRSTPRPARPSSRASRPTSPSSKPPWCRYRPS